MLVSISDINDDDHSYGRPCDEAAYDGGMGFSHFLCLQAADAQLFARQLALGWRRRKGRCRGSTTGSGPAASPGGPAGGCCDGGRILGTNPHTGQPVCSCQYSPGLLTYSRVAAGLTESVYPGSPYATPGKHVCQLVINDRLDAETLAAVQTSPYDLKEAGETWRGITQPTACYPYDPTAMTTYPYTNA
ncbi:hypothetical protein C0Q70_19111 [Pomacea canaliculata]|uniref:Uncharacterized protein n=1 Tax=Pomacea canaliculata TaxID=400727 RepID=A0A2T7NIH1_POMCA|nr:hypothetical protein C0Q70_19111 [Pomacea canaliculata]